MSSVPERTEHSTDELNEAIGPAVDIPGPYPTGDAPNSPEAGEAVSHPSESSESTTTPTHAESLGDLTKEVSTSAVPQDSGGLGSSIYEDDESKGE